MFVLVVSIFVVCFVSSLLHSFLIDCLVFPCFFFFKRKTAYELRISDWSSDVCSSDLRCHVHSQVRLAAGLGVNMASVREAVKRLEQLRLENGRGSCRGRVCQYV